MSTSDLVKWTLLDTDLATRIGEDGIPVLSSSLLFVYNEPGSGETKLPLDANIVSNISSGKFLLCNYRGADIGGFFVEAIREVDADQSEGKGRVYSVRGQGPLALLDTYIVLNNNSNDKTRSFENMTKAAILIQLIDEAQAAGALASLTYDFSATLDSSSVLWSDSESLSIPVGQKLLDVVRSFSKSGEFNVSMDLSGGGFVLSAYKNAIGSNLSSTIYFQVGMNCEEVTKDLRGGRELVNQYLYKSKVGFGIVGDDTSIAANGLYADFLNIEQAQSDATARTYAAAKLSLNKDPKENKSVKIFDGVKPNAFIDYNLGDTVSLDRFGTITQDKILSMQFDFSNETYAEVYIDFNYIFIDNDIKTQQKLDDLLDQWSTAFDAGLLELSEGLSIGGTNGLVNAIHNYGDYVYVGGGFTFVGNLSTNYTARYRLSTHTWEELTGISATVIKIIDVSGTIYACTATKVYVLSGTAWSLIGTATAGNTLRCMTTDGTDLYVGGNLTQIDAVTINGKVAKRHAGVWSDLNSNPIIYFAESMAFFNSVLYIGFGGVGIGSSSLKRFDGGSYTNIMNLGGKYIFALKQVGSNLIIMSDDNNGNSAATCIIYSWDGVSIGPGIGSAIIIGTITDFMPVATTVGNGSCSINNYLTDIYISGDFNILDGVTGYNGIAKYSGGVWTQLKGGVSSAAGDGVTAIEVVDNDIYIGGIFTTAFGINTIDLSVFVTDFESLVDHLANDPNYTFDMGAAIHSAAASAITDNDEVPFWKDVAKALRKITWANIKIALALIFPAHTLSTAENDFLVGGTGGAANTWVKKTLAEVKAILGLGSMAFQNVNGWLPSPDVWSYSSVDGPSGVLSIAEDYTDILNLGDKIKYQQSQALSAYWSFDVNNAADVGAFTMTNVGTPTYTAGKFGNALTLNGTTQALQITDTATLKPTGEWTFGCWMKTNTTGTFQPLFQTWSQNTNWAGIKIQCQTTTNGLQVVTGKNTGTTLNTDYTVTTSPTNLCDNTWHYVVITFRNNWLQIYVDGKLDAAGWAFAPAYAGTNYIRIGVINNTGSDTNFFNGQIDDLFFINGYAMDELWVYEKYAQGTAQGTSSITVTKMAIITKIGTYSGGATLITAFHGTDYSLSNSAISNPYFSHAKTPFKFQADPSKWTVEVQSFADCTKTTPTGSTWYGGSLLTPTGPSIDVPIGEWFIEYKLPIGDNYTAAAAAVWGMRVTLSTANNTQSEPKFTSNFAFTTPIIAANGALRFTGVIREPLRLYSKTTYYVNIFAGAVTAGDVIGIFGSIFPATLRAVCAYL